MGFSIGDDMEVDAGTRGSGGGARERETQGHSVFAAALQWTCQGARYGSHAVTPADAFHILHPGSR
jgi:hypothetical protein